MQQKDIKGILLSQLLANVLFAYQITPLCSDINFHYIAYLEQSNWAKLNKTSLN